MKNFTAAFLLSLSSLSFAGDMPGPEDLDFLTGKCEKDSHIAKGTLGSDLTKQRARFTCNSVSIAFFDKDTHHIMLHFGSTGRSNKPVLGFAGFMDEDGKEMDVQRVYLNSAIKDVEDGRCKFSFKRNHMQSIDCAAAIDNGNQRTVLAVLFSVDPRQ